MLKCIVCKFYTAPHDICFYCRASNAHLNNAKSILIEAINVVEHEIIDIMEYLNWGSPKYGEDAEAWNAYHDLRYIKVQAIDRRNELIMQLREACA